MNSQLSLVHFISDNQATVDSFRFSLIVVVVISILENHINLVLTFMGVASMHL